MTTSQALGITDVVLRDSHQSLLATRFRIDDMLPIAAELDDVGYWSLESWGGATFDSCIRYLGEDPWDRIRELKKAMPKTPQQMLLRGQNLLGYRHYADDVVEKFVERAAINGVDVFRVFDAMNDPRNLRTALQAVLRNGKHAQGTISYTVSPVHTLQTWLDLARNIEDMGAESLAIKDMAGLLRPYEAYELISQLKSSLAIPIHMHCHATTGLSTATILKAIEAGIDNVDTSISSMSMTYGHSPTESVVAILEGTERDTGLNIEKLEGIAAYFRDVRKKYTKFEGALRGVDSRILVAQVPGGMLTNMENQLREQGASDRLNEVLDEIPRVRVDLGYIPLVTPTSQIVGTQAVLNVLTGERYKSIAKETAGVLKGEYGATAAPVNSELQKRVLDGSEAVVCRPADLIDPELSSLQEELKEVAAEKNITLRDDSIDDVLTYALFQQIGLKFLANRGDASVFESHPDLDAPIADSVPAADASNSAATPSTAAASYTVSVDGQVYQVVVQEGGAIDSIVAAPQAAAPIVAVADTPAVSAAPSTLSAPLAGNIFRVDVSPGDRVEAGDVVMILEAMKMETEVRADKAGTIQTVHVAQGASVSVGEPLLSLG
ncbi:MAG: sodium-extruding oxaloacetate decarboxylase subunit alpha [Pseudomonadota bacterium]